MRILKLLFVVGRYGRNISGVLLFGRERGIFERFDLVRRLRLLRSLAGLP